MRSVSRGGFPCVSDWRSVCRGRPHWRGAIYGQVADPDKDGDPLGICTDIAVRTSGPCAYKKSGRGKYSTYFSVNGTYYEGGDFWVELAAPGGKGTCTVELRARDSWDATTVQQVRITVD